MNGQIGKYLKYFALAAMVYMPIFGHLDSLPIRIWDEARLALNAYEMHHNGNYIVTHFAGEPDMWNTKPPLLIWLQVLFMKVLGVNELSVRLPSAFAALFTCVVLWVFSNRYLKDFWFGFIVVGVLITSPGYIDEHATRTGDYDALLTLFTTLGGLLFFAYCETQNRKRLHLFFLVTALAVLTKGVAGLLFLPALAIYALFRRQFLPLLKNKDFYIGILGFVLLVGGYYLLREMQNPGFLTAVYANELGGRYLEVIEEHSHGFWFYYNDFRNDHPLLWQLLIPCGVAVGFAWKNQRINRLTLFSILMAGIYFLIISTAETKLEWYAVPLYPFLAIPVAIFIYFVFDALKNSRELNRKFSVGVLPFLFLFLVGAVPYGEIWDKTYKPKEMDGAIDFYEIGRYLQDAVEGRHDLNGQFLLYEGYGAQNTFYLHLLNDQGVEVAYKDWRSLDAGDVVFAHQPEVKEFVEENYAHEVVSVHGAVLTYEIHGKRD